MAASTTPTPIASGAPEAIITRPITSAPSSSVDPMSTVKTTLSLALRMVRSLASATVGPTYSGGVSDQDINPPEAAHGPKVESHDQPVPEKYAAFMRTGWGDRELDLPAHPVVPFAAARRARLAEMFPGERLVVPSGTFKVRANDTDYRFRADSAHTHLTGNQTSDAVLVIEGGESTLFARPRSSRQTDEFFRDRRYGELWVGRRPSLKEISDSLGLEVRHLGELDARLEASAKTRVLRGVDAFVDTTVPADGGRDHDFA